MTRDAFEALSKGDKDMWLFDALQPLLASSETTGPDSVLLPRMEPKPAPYSNSHTEAREWKPVGTGELYWTDLLGFTIERSMVPEDVITKWEAQKESGEGS